MRPTAVLFDFDGTLAPNLDLPDMRRQVLELTQTLDVPSCVYKDKYIVEIIDAACTWLNKQQRQTHAQNYYDAAHQLIVDIEIREAATTNPFPEVPHMLTILRKHNLKLGVVTRNCRPAVLTVFPELLNYVDALVARDDYHFLKPDPKHLTHCLSLLECDASTTVMVGDGALDMQVGSVLNMFCVGVLTGSSNAAVLQKNGADLVVETLSATSPWARWGFG